jgi:beta-N-acetylhexosaminidase
MTGMDRALHRMALGTMLASFPGTVPPAWAGRLLEEGLAGYVLFGYNVADPEQLRDLVIRLHEVRPDAIVGIDEEGGDVTRLAHAEGSHYPGNAALGAADDTDLTRQVYRAIGTELHDVGITLNLAPDVDVNSSDQNPIIGTRSFGTDPALVARHTTAAVTGLQSAGVAACAKHFPGHGATVADSHEELPTVDASLDVLRERELPPFVAAIEAGARAVMTAHIRVPALTGDLPATLSRRVLTDLLRDQLGFTGAVLTDALEMRGACGDIGIPQAAVRALAAGADVLCSGDRGGGGGRGPRGSGSGQPTGAGRPADRRPGDHTAGVRSRCLPRARVPSRGHRRPPGASGGGQPAEVGPAAAGADRLPRHDRRRGTAVGDRPLP